MTIFVWQPLGGGVFHLRHRFTQVKSPPQWRPFPSRATTLVPTGSDRRPVIPPRTWRRGPIYPLQAGPCVAAPARQSHRLRAQSPPSRAEYPIGSGRCTWVLSTRDHPYQVGHERPNPTSAACRSMGPLGIGYHSPPPVPLGAPRARLPKLGCKARVYLGWHWAPSPGACCRGYVALHCRR